MELAKRAMNEDAITILGYARRKIGEYRRLLSLDPALRYSSEIEEEKLMNLISSTIKELEVYFKNNPEKARGTEIPTEIIPKINELKKNLVRLSCNLARLSVSISSQEDSYLE